MPAEKQNALFGEGNYKSMPDEVCWQLRFEPAKWTAKKHLIKVYVGTDGMHQDEFLRGDHPDTLYRGSIATPSLLAGIINSKYVNSSPLERTAREFQTIIQTDHVQLGGVVCRKIFPAGIRTNEGSSCGRM